jgi:hypothetical protein
LQRALVILEQTGNLKHLLAGRTLNMQARLAWESSINNGRKRRGDRL